MRTAYKVWLGAATSTFILFAILDLAGPNGQAATTSAQGQTAESSSFAASSSTSDDQLAPAQTSPEDAPSSAGRPTTTVGEPVEVTRVTDGDTLVVNGDRDIRVLGIDACEMSTPGGRRAKESLESALDNPGNYPVTLTREPGVDKDRYGRELRYVQLAGADLGEYMIGAPEVGVYQGHNDANPEYVERLREEDLYPRDCSAGLAAIDSPNVDIPNHHDRNHRDGALTGGFCARRRWC